MLDMVFGNAEKVMGFLNEEQKKAWKITEKFMSETLFLQASLHDYSGTDWCSGFLFGMRGANVLIKVGKEVEKTHLIM